MADGIFYNDLREPFVAADITAVTLAATQKALYPAASFPVLGAGYFNRIGKKLRIRLFGRITTVLTPGNLTLGTFWGTGADANGTSLGTSAAIALVASQTNLSWWWEVDVTCRAVGTSGALLLTGFFYANPAVIASTAQPVMVPASAAAQVTVDTTAANIISLQALRSGSTAETMQVHDMSVLALN